MQTTYEKKRYCVNLGSMAGSTGSWNSSPRLAMLPAIIQTSVPDLFGHALEPATLFADLQCFVGLGVEGAIRRPDQAPAPGRKLRLELRALHPRPRPLAQGARDRRPAPRKTAGHGGTGLRSASYRAVIASSDVNGDAGNPSELNRLTTRSEEHTSELQSPMYL